MLPHQNHALPAAKRVQDPLSRMMLEEKAAQMVCVWRQKAEKLVNAAGDFEFQKTEAAFKKGHAPGQVGRPGDAGSGKNARSMPGPTNAIQKFFLENTRRGIRVVFHEECLFRHAAIGGRSFPQPIASGPKASIPAATTALDQRSQK
jgi:beta-glucosidase